MLHPARRLASQAAHRGWQRQVRSAPPATAELSALLMARHALLAALLALSLACGVRAAATPPASEDWVAASAVFEARLRSCAWHTRSYGLRCVPALGSTHLRRWPPAACRGAAPQRLRGRCSGALTLLSRPRHPLRRRCADRAACWARRRRVAPRRTHFAPAHRGGAAAALRRRPADPRLSLTRRTPCATLQLKAFVADEVQAGHYPGVGVSKCVTPPAPRISPRNATQPSAQPPRDFWQRFSALWAAYRLHAPPTVFLARHDALTRLRRCVALRRHPPVPPAF
jgi:hypothetical protein